MYMYIFLSHKTQLQLQLHYSTVGDMQVLRPFHMCCNPYKNSCVTSKTSSPA